MEDCELELTRNVTKYYEGVRSNLRISLTWNKRAVYLLNSDK